MQDMKGLKYSAILHAVILLLLVFGLPEFLEPRPIPEPQVITTEILPIAPISNVKPQEKTPDKPKPKTPVEEKKTERKAKPEASKEAPKKQETPPLPQPVKKPLPKKPEKPKEEKTPKKQEDDLDNILKSVEKTAKAEESKKPTEKKTQPNQHEAKSERYDPSMQLSMSEKDAIRQQFEKCWDVPSGAKDAQNLIITLSVTVNQDGTVLTAELARDKGRYMSDSFFRAAADSALRAVHRCSPLKNLSADKYGTWKDMEVTFDPRSMLY